MEEYINITLDNIDQEHICCAISDKKHSEGVLSMARTMIPDSAGSQFFIMVDDAPYLDGQYAAFGKVTEGMETADAIVSVPRDPMDKPYEEQKMKSVRVDTHGETYTVEKLKGRG